MLPVGQAGTLAAGIVSIPPCNGSGIPGRARASCFLLPFLLQPSWALAQFEGGRGGRHKLPNSGQAWLWMGSTWGLERPFGPPSAPLARPSGVPRLPVTQGYGTLSLLKTQACWADSSAWPVRACQDCAAVVLGTRHLNGAKGWRRTGGGRP